MAKRATHVGPGSPLILASGSPRRKAFLRDLGLPFRTILSRVSEDVRGGEPPEEHVLRLAREKAQDVARRRPEKWVIGADTVVLVDRLILGKPATPQEARGMLEALQGRAHEVLTGICVMRAFDQRVRTRLVRTTVHIREITPGEMAWYVDTGEPFDKAGGYAIQGLGSVFVTRIEGSYTNVVGLPVPELVQMLRELGAWDLFSGR
jgi:septum formation protein